MGLTVIVIGAPERVRQSLEREFGRSIQLLVLRLSQAGSFFSLEPRHTQSAIQMMEATWERCQQPQNCVIIRLPYVKPPQEVDDLINAFADLGSTVIWAPLRESRWPTRPKTLDGAPAVAFSAELHRRIAEIIRPSLDGGDEITVESAISRARSDFAQTLEFPEAMVIDTKLDGAFWYQVFAALDDVCAMERAGQVSDKRTALRERLKSRIGKPKDTYKSGDTGVYVTSSIRGRVHLTERVHIKEGKPAETESVYWVTFGRDRANFVYLVGRLGRHA